MVFIFDESDSMRPHVSALTSLFDSEIKFLAERSREFNQETRISVYLFSSRGTARCVLYDMDVLRVQESYHLKDFYKPRGMTALCDAAVLAVNDLKMLPTKYGQHSMWLLVFTDGYENDSTTANRSQIKPLLSSLGEEWTVSIFVPDQMGKKYAKDYGFPHENVAIWDTSSVRGLEDVGHTVREAAKSYFTMRSTGARGTKSLFSLNTVSTDTIKSQLTPLKSGTYTVLQYSGVRVTVQIRDFVESQLYIPYKVGHAYYELKKRETIQPQKAIVVEHQGQYYSGQPARDLLGLPDYDVKVDPDYKAGYTIFVQSTSVNRNIIPGQRVLYLHGTGPLTRMRTF